MIIIELTLLSYFIYVAFYTLIFAFAGLVYKSKIKAEFSLSPIDSRKVFAVFIPGYKEDSVIVNVAIQALKQQFPSDNYDVIVIADSFKNETLAKLRTLDIHVLEVEFEQSTKVKALNKAFEEYKDKYQYAVILDADNVMDSLFLSKMYYLHSEGFAAIQGKRAAKNSENSLSFLDGLSEAINTHIFCKGSCGLNMSSSLKGSGMSFDFKILSDLLASMNNVGGFDRELEIKFLEKGVKVIYEDSAIVLDEKTSDSSAFNKQRRRWVSSQYIYLQKYFFKGFKHLLLGFNLTYFNSSVLRNIQLPRLLNLGLVFIFTLLAFVLSPYLYFDNSEYLWLMLMALTYFGTLLSIPREYFSWQLVIAIFKLPSIFFKMIRMLFGLKNADKSFIHTPHSS